MYERTIDSEAGVQAFVEALFRRPRNHARCRARTALPHPPRRPIVSHYRDPRLSSTFVRRATSLDSIDPENAPPILTIHLSAAYLRLVSLFPSPRRLLRSSVLQLTSPPVIHARSREITRRQGSRVPALKSLLHGVH